MNRTSVLIERMSPDGNVGLMELVLSVSPNRFFELREEFLKTKPELPAETQEELYPSYGSGYPHWQRTLPRDSQWRRFVRWMSVVKEVEIDEDVKDALPFWPIDPLQRAAWKANWRALRERAAQVVRFVPLYQMNPPVQDRDLN